MSEAVVVVLEVVEIAHRDGKRSAVPGTPLDLPPEVLLEKPEVVEARELVLVRRGAGLLEGLELDDLGLVQTLVHLHEVAHESYGYVYNGAQRRLHRTPMVDNGLPVALRLIICETQMREQVQKRGIHGRAILPL